MLKSTETVFTQLFDKEFGPYQKDGFIYSGTICLLPEDVLISRLDAISNVSTQDNEGMKALSIEQKQKIKVGRRVVTDVKVSMTDNTNIWQLTYIHFKTQRWGVLTVSSIFPEQTVKDAIFNIDSSRKIRIINPEETSLTVTDIESILTIAAHHFRDGVQISVDGNISN